MLLNIPADVVARAANLCDVGVFPETEHLVAAQILTLLRDALDDIERPRVRINLSLPVRGGGV